MGRPKVFEGGGGSEAVVLLNSVTVFRRSLVETAMDWVWGITEDNVLTMGWTSFTIEVTVWLVKSRLRMEVLIVLMVSDIPTMCLACLVVVALMNLHSHSMLVMAMVFSLESLCETAEMISVEVLSVSLCNSRKPTALIVDAVVSGILLSRDRAKRTLARVGAEKLLLIAMRAHCSR